MIGHSSTGRVLFLNYHSLDVGMSSKTYHVDPVYSVKRAAFEAQLAVIAASGTPVLSLSEYLERLAQRVPFVRNSLVITFDDGFTTDYEVAYPRLVEHGFSATFFVCMLNIESDARWQQMREMVRDGFAIGSHTVSHRYLTSLSAHELEHELAESKRSIEANTEQRVRFLAPPGGRYSAFVSETAQRLGYEALLTTRVGVNDHRSDAMALKRWTVRAQTSLPEFERMIQQEPRELGTKQLKSRALDLGKRVLGDSAFDRLRSTLLAG